MAAIIISEVLVAVKFEPQTVFKPIPFHMSLFWIAGIMGLLAFTVWKFYLRTHFFLHKKQSPRHTGNGAALYADQRGEPVRRPNTRGFVRSKKTEWDAETLRRWMTLLVDLWKDAIRMTDCSCIATYHNITLVLVLIRLSWRFSYAIVFTTSSPLDLLFAH